MFSINNRLQESQYRDGVDQEAPLANLKRKKANHSPFKLMVTGGCSSSSGFSLDFL
jgi:hypothetical protein